MNPVGRDTLYRWETAILSNGSSVMLQSAVNHAGIVPLLDEMILVDPAKHIKPHKLYTL
ncbi:MAG: hypothetical protein GY761_03465 [Hyphomicrobiales bacterium]|nr:hypothetical protein [Hyphomicrobiales bacterium]